VTIVTGTDFLTGVSLPPFAQNEGCQRASVTPAG